MNAPVPATETFVARRNLLFTIAYEMLGSAVDAEDVLQETWLRPVKVDQAQVSDQRAYLVRITPRQALNRLRTMKRRKETYVGPWLPDRCSPRRTWPRTSNSPRACRCPPPRQVVSESSETRAALQSLQYALVTGDPQRLLDVLAPDVVLVGDGGGVKQATLRPVIGAEKVVRMFVGGFPRSAPWSPVNPPW
ncbi:sigma factor [Spirillospora sp. CA-255316]